MGYLLSLSTISKSAAETGLNISEILLLVCGFILAWGCIGEYLEEHNRLDKFPKWLQWPSLVFILMVALSLVGEFVGDAGVYLFSYQLQSIEGAELTRLGAHADKLEERLKLVDGTSNAAGAAARTALGNSGKAVLSSTTAINVARGASAIANSFEKDIVSAKEQAASAQSHLAEAVSMARAEEAELTKLATQLAPRTIHPDQLARIRVKLKALGPREYTLWIAPDIDSWSLMATLRDTLEGAGWTYVAPGVVTIGPAGIIVTDRVRIGVAKSRLSDLGPIADAITKALTAEGVDAIGPVSGSELDRLPNVIHIIIGAKHQDR